MNPPPPASSAGAPRTAFWLASAAVVLPFLQALPIDFDRSAVLLVLLPALWSGRHLLAEAVRSLSHGDPWMQTALTITGCATVVSIYFSAQRAPAIVCAASWLVLAAAGAIAGGLVRADDRSTRPLLGGLALGAAAGAGAMWTLWLTGGRGAVPLYAHHRILGLHMIAGAMASTALIVGSRTATQRRLWLAVGAFTWGALLWSGGRAPLLALAGGLTLWAILCSRDRRALFTASTLQLLAGLALSAMFWTPRAELGWWHAFARTAAAAQPGAIDVSALTSTRSEFWRASVQHGLASPWIGHGPDAYRFFTPKLDGQQPHNFVLQLWLDLGIAGAVPALLLLGGALGVGWRKVRRAESAPGLAPWLALLSALSLAGLLDGVFYHVLTLLPALLALGVILLQLVPPDNNALPAPARSRAPVTLGAVGAALALLALHSVVFHVLAVAPPPAGADAPAARLVRAFPSTTFGLWTWLDQWHRTDPATALAWARWAQGHAANPAIFHIRAAQYLHVQGDLVAARAELHLAETKAHWTTRPAIAELRKNLSAPP